MDETPAMESLPSLIDEALRITEERVAIDPSYRLYDSIQAQLTYIRSVVRGERLRDESLDGKLLLDYYAAREFETSDPAFADLLANAHYLYKRWSPPATPPATPSRRSGTITSRLWWGLVALGVTGMLLGTIGAGTFLLVQTTTGPRALAIVGGCTTIGSGRYRHVHCTGSWTEGGSLLDGGHIVIGDIVGAGTRDIGKELDVTVHGTTAYRRDLKPPLLLIALGIVPCLAAVSLIGVVRRRRA